MSKVLTKKQIATNLVKFMDFTNNFSEIQRKKLKNNGLWENDGEHSFQLALVSWYLADQLNLNLNMEKVFKYALAHDLPETYAGDVDSFTKDKQLLANKQDREKLAKVQISKEFPEIPELVTTIDTYELKGDKEAQFVYAMDKIIPVINVYLFKNDNYFHKRKISLKEFIKERIPRLECSKEVADLFVSQVIPFLDEVGIFHKN